MSNNTIPFIPEEFDNSQLQENKICITIYKRLINYINGSNPKEHILKSTVIKQYLRVLLKLLIQKDSLTKKQHENFKRLKLILNSSVINGIEFPLISRAKKFIIYLHALSEDPEINKIIEEWDNNSIYF